MRIVPAGVPREARALFWGRGLRAFGDGYVSLLLPAYLTALGFTGFEVGALTTATLLGSAALTLAVGFVSERFGRRTLLIVATLLMIGTGLGFTLVTDFWPLLAIAFIGTLNPSSGDVSLFLPLEQALLAGAVKDEDRTAAFAGYALVGGLAGAAGALATGAPELLQRLTRVPLDTALQAMFAFYALLGLVTYHLYRRRLPASLDHGRGGPRVPLGPSRRVVLTLAGIFCIDAFAGGLVIQSLLALWLYEHFGLSLAAAGAIFFWSGLLQAMSYPTAALLARRIGLVNTMVFTHLPANGCLAALPFAPGLGVAVVLLFVRAFLSQMDVPTRTSYVMAVVTPPERAAAASITLLPRSLAAAAGPLVAGSLLSMAAFGWALVLAGGLKAAYDLIMLFLFRRHRPPEER
ncbi:MAG TPA: MFS transporter [Stellaceae bacterium]|nr:MFS transporter [Stellaceae bacterium]